jgi:DNA polymerase-3 subunit epsilon
LLDGNGKIEVMKYDTPIVIVDVETTGMSPVRGRVIEIACIRIEHGKETDRFVSLVDPEQRVGLQIEAITSITDSMLRGAPTFSQIAKRVDEIFEGAVLCAHNARFDYGFIKAEMERAGYVFKKTLLCTAKLSRSLFKEYQKHDLSSIIDRYGFTCEARHRAEGDADVLVQFLSYVEHTLEGNHTAAIKQVTGSTCIPAQLEKSIVDELPETPGVYTFYGEQGEVLYIGKSVNIRSRVMSHFSNTHRDGKEMRLWREVYDIGHVSTVSDLGASLVELSKIKTEFPVYNRMSRKVERLWYVQKHTDETLYATFSLVPDDNITSEKLDSIYGVFKSKRQGVKVLTELAKEHKLCPKLLGIESGKGVCFSHQLGLCSGACAHSVDVTEYNALVEQVFADRKMRTWPYKGKVTLKYYDERKERAEVFVVDNWILEQALVYETDEPQHLLGDLEHMFDYDVYKVLIRFMIKGEGIVDNM